MIINHTGQTIPIVCRIDGSPVKYDHIVCDVPCSGDGTIRKNPNTGSNWHPDRGNSRFLLQLNITRRGLELSKVGGTLVYSSCSINQIENEAVIAALLNESDGNLELVDVNGKFPGLNWLPGLSYWKVFDSKMNEYSKYEDVSDDGFEEDWSGVPIQEFMACSDNLASKRQTGMLADLELGHCYSFHRVCSLRKIEFMILLQHFHRRTLLSLSFQRLIVSILVEGVDDLQLQEDGNSEERRGTSISFSVINPVYLYLHIVLF